MKIYVVLLHDWPNDEHYILGAYSTLALAGEAMEGIMNADYGKTEYTDWDLNDIAGNWQYFYEDFTVEIQRMTLDD